VAERVEPDHDHTHVPMRILVASLFIYPATLHAQSKYDLTGKPDATINESFTYVAGVRELPGNRAIVTDQSERTVFEVDFSSGRRRQIGRQGDGPAEYRFPMAPFSAPDNTTWMLDATRRVVHVIAADGSFRPSLSAPYGAVPGGLLSARGVDAVGRIYFEGNSFNSETGRFTDSVAIIRWTPSANRAEIIGKVWSGGRVTIQRQGSPASISRSILPFPHIDAWTPLADGRIAVVRQSPHTIGFLQPEGNLVSGAVLNVPTIPVTAAERAAYRERNSARRMVAAGGADARRMEIEDEAFPPNMPAFIASSVISDPTGRIWIGRSYRATDRTWRYDLYDAKGGHAGQATVPAHSRIVGFGDGVVYLARTDPTDDQVYLERHRLRSQG
jgi:hypothetical protein